MPFHVYAALPRARPLLVSACVVAAAFAARPASAQQISYTLVPAAEFVTWDNSLALEDDWLAGARFSLRFGPFIELAPFYLTRRGLDLDPDRAQDVFGVPAASASPNVEHFGAKVQANFGRQGLIPFLRLGGGILRIDPETAPRRDRVAVSAGGGLRFGLTWLQGEVFAEQLAFRLEPANLFAPGTPAPGRAPLHRNTVYGAAVMIPLSEVGADVPMPGLRGVTAPLEPFVGRLNYDGDRLPDQDLFGVRAGIDFSPLVGMRAFYWRGADDDFRETDAVSGYGVEAQFNLNTGPGIAPFLVLGGGRLDYGSGFTAPAGGTPDDQTALILGGGATFRLWDRIGLNVALRDYILSIDAPLDATGDPDDLTHNTVLSGGLTIAIGGDVRPEPLVEPTERPQVDIARLRAQIDSLRREAELAQRPAPGIDTAAIDTTGVPAEAVTDTVTRMVQEGMAGRSRLVVAPAPAQGEVIFRYGFPPPAPRDTTAEARERITLDDVRSLLRAELRTDTTGEARDRITLDDIRSVVRAELQADTMAQRIPARQQQPVAPPAQPQEPRVDTTIVRLPTTTLGAEEFEQRLAAFERRMSERLDALEERLRRQAAAAEPVRAPVTERESPGTVQEPSRSLFARLADFEAEDLRPFIGTTLTDETQFVVSARADLGPLTPESEFRLWPEIAFSFGDGERTLLALANLQYPFPTFGGGDAFQPYVLGGLGIFSETAVVLNTAIGANYNLRAGRGGSPLFAYLEWQGLNLFDYSRLLIGLSMTR